MNVLFILPRLTFWASPFDGCPKICREHHKDTLLGKGWFFISELWPTQGELLSLFNINFLKYVPNSIYKKRKFNIMIKLDMSFPYVPPCCVYDFSQWWLLVSFCTVASKQTRWPQIFLQILQVCTQNDISWTLYKNHNGTSTPNSQKHDHYATHSQIWYRPIFALKALSYKFYSSAMIQNHS